ncbi:MAG: hypothetical protein JWM80_774 [Cyanobacteria bacterium RYN_339]|nr:hypothetical protein [Cyanobacteria bacterium RYN_339]
MIADAFLASDVCHRLQALNTEITQTLPLGGNELLAAEYVPKQGALSEWDDETRLVLYRWDGGRGFERVQFVSKAGKSIKGKLAGLELFDFDHDGVPEIVAIGGPYGPSARVASKVYRRTAAGGKFENVWLRKDFGAAFDLRGPAYVTLDHESFKPRRTGLAIQDGKLGER